MLTYFSQIAIPLLFALSISAITARFLVRLVQRQFTAGDGFIVFGTCFLIVAVTILFVTLDDMFKSQAFLDGDAAFELPSDVLGASYRFHKMLTVSLMFSWLAIVSVKFSFLALFRDLIDRLPRLIIYWRVTLVFNVTASVYGLGRNLIACPYFGLYYSSCKSLAVCFKFEDIFV